MHVKNGIGFPLQISLGGHKKKGKAIPLLEKHLVPGWPGQGRQ